METIFANRVALVTGSSRGIGRAIALELAWRGASVAINFVEQKDSADKLVALIQSMGRSAQAIRADVSKYTEVKAMIAEVGKIDFVINNAGIHLDYAVKNMPLGHWQRVIDVNLTGTFNCCKCVLEAGLKLEPSSRIINITSVIGQTGGFGAANSAASKAGIIGLTKSLAKELARYGATANAVALGYIRTGMGNTLPPQVLEAALQQIPLRRRGRPSEIAGTVAFLCSQEAGYITGSVINVNGGLL